MAMQLDSESDLLRPNVSEDWLGPSEDFYELGLSVSSHPNPEFKVTGVNEVEIVLRYKPDRPLKQQTQLLYGKSFTNLANDYVLCQRNRENTEISYRLGFKDNGYYRFSIHALEETNSSDMLPNAINYLIHVERLGFKAAPYPRQLDDLYEGYCQLLEPMRISSQTIAASRRYNHIRFRIIVPEALKVAVRCKEVWTQLKQSEDTRYWEGDVDLSEARKAKNSVVTVSAQYKGRKGYTALLDYTIEV